MFVSPSRCFLHRNMAVLIVILCSAVLSGCAPVATVQSNLDPNYHAQLKNVYVVVDVRKIDEATQQILSDGGEFEAAVLDTTSFSTYFLPALAANFATVGVEIRQHLITGLELSDDEVFREVGDLVPDTVLNVHEDWFLVHTSNELLGLMSSSKVTAIDLTASIMKEGEKDVAAWRALIKIETGDGGVRIMAESLATGLVEQLVADGLIKKDYTQATSPKDAT